MNLICQKIKRLESTTSSPNNTSIEERLNSVENANHLLEERLAKLEMENKELAAKLKELDLNKNEPIISEEFSRKSYQENLTNPRTNEEQLLKSRDDKENKVFDKKICQLEQADLYLQETNKLMNDKLSAFESMLKISSCSNDDTRQQLLAMQESLELIKYDIQCSGKTAMENYQLLTKNEKQPNTSEPIKLPEKETSNEHHEDISTTSFPTGSLTDKDTKCLSGETERIAVVKSTSFNKDVKPRLQSSKFSIWMKKRRKCFQCISKQPSMMHLEAFETYSLVEKN